jgi:sensor histidine kinase regulating citrate/malate metabolism
MQVLVVVVLVVVATVLAVYDARHDARAAATARAVAVAAAMADSPTVHAALDDPDPSRVLQPLAERVRRDAHVDFVVVMKPDRTRYTHPDPARIGEPFVGDLGGAPQGHVFTQEYTGTLGPSMRAVVPVTDTGRGSGRGPGGRVVALVSVGITVDHIDQQVRREVGVILLAGLLVAGAGALGAWLVSRRLRRQTHGLGEREITRMYEYYSAVLHAVREGLLLIDDRQRVQLVNDEARRLLDLPEDVVGRPLPGLPLPPALVETVLRSAGGTGEGTDELYVAGERVLVVSSAPASWQGRAVGAVVSLRDHTELRAVTGELDVVRRLSESLRAQTHEAANRLHTVVSLVEMGRPEQAVEFATAELAVAQRLTDRMLAAVGDPVLAALLLGKSAEGAERGIELDVTGELADAEAIASRDLVTVVGNLVDNAFDAVAGRSPARVVVGLESGPTGGVVLTVADNGPGLPPEQAELAFERGWTTKHGDHTGVHSGGRGVGLALVRQVVRRYGGRLEVGRSPLGGAELRVTLPGTAPRAVPR